MNKALLVISSLLCILIFLVSCKNPFSDQESSSDSADSMEGDVTLSVTLPDLEQMSSGEGPVSDFTKVEQVFMNYISVNDIT